MNQYPRTDRLVVQMIDIEGFHPISEALFYRLLPECFSPLLPHVVDVWLPVSIIDRSFSSTIVSLKRLLEPAFS